VIAFQLTSEVLGRTRFAFSPLSEVTLSLRLLGRPHPVHLHRPWLREARARLGRVDVPLLLAMVPPGKWIPSFLVPAEEDPRATIQDQLNELIRRPPAELAAEIDQAWEERPVPRRLADLLDSGARGPGMLAEAL
jgi:hypothetical protein